MTSKEIVSSSVRLYTGRYSLSLLQFLLLLSAACSGIMLFKLLKTMLLPDMVWGYNPDTFTAAGIAAVIAVVIYFVGVPYFYGGLWYTCTAAAVRNVPPAALFGCYSDPGRIFKAIRVELALIARKAIVFVPVFLVCVVETLTAMRVMSISHGFLPIAAAGGCVLSLAGLFMLYKFYALRFFAVRFIFTEEPSLSASEMIRRSLAMTKGKGNLLAAIFLRLIPYYIVSLLILPLICTPPIIGGCYAYAYRELKKEYEQQ
jgi:hypothetical protein